MNEDDLIIKKPALLHPHSHALIEGSDGKIQYKYI